MAAPLVPLSQQVWCWGASRGGADRGCRGKDKTSWKSDSRGPRRRALKARKAEWRGPGGSEGDRPARPAYSCASCAGYPPPHPPSRCEEVMGRGRCACLLLPGPGQAVFVWGDVLRAASRFAPTVAGEGGGPAASLCLPRGRASGRVVSQSGVARGSAARPLRLRPSSPPSPWSRFRSSAPCEKRGSYAPKGGLQSASSKSLDVFLKHIKRHRDVQKSREKAIVLLGETFIHSFILQPHL